MSELKTLADFRQFAKEVCLLNAEYENFIPTVYLSKKDKENLSKEFKGVNSINVKADASSSKPLIDNYIIILGINIAIKELN